MYALQEKLIMSEYRGLSLDDPIARMSNLQEEYDRVIDINYRRTKELKKLRDSLVRLKSDLNLFKVSNERKAK